MSALPPADAARFGKIIGLLASNHDGERATAALKATEFLNARQMGWGSVAEAMIATPAVRPEPRRAPAPPFHQVDARECLRSPVAWSAKERQFLLHMTDQHARPSTKQRDWLDGLLDKMKRQHREASNAEW